MLLLLNHCLVKIALVAVFKPLPFLSHCRNYCVLLQCHFDFIASIDYKVYDIRGKDPQATATTPHRHKFAFKPVERSVQQDPRDV